jgi:hypothetical protein
VPSFVLLCLSQKQISADLEDFAKTRPDLYKECIAKIQEADKPGIRPTVAAAKGARAQPQPQPNQRAFRPGDMAHGHSVLLLEACRACSSLALTCWNPRLTPTSADPNACKYTVEGTMGYDLMRIVSKADRRMRLVSELEVTLTAADKDAIKKMLTDKAIEGGVDPKAVDMSVPDKCVPATALARAPLTRASTHWWTSASLTSSTDPSPLLPLLLPLSAGCPCLSERAERSGTHHLLLQSTRRGVCTRVPIFFILRCETRADDLQRPTAHTTVGSQSTGCGPLVRGNWDVASSAQDDRAGGISLVRLESILP